MRPTGHAPANGLGTYSEIHGSGEPAVLLHGAFMISDHADVPRVAGSAG
ncbi:MAG: hypothetical protein IT359_10610 [Gemmatimonadaceae bacterium]|nr:hypothetical protein [Gemmatimonadaceae bacterium]